VSRRHVHATNHLVVLAVIAIICAVVSWGFALFGSTS